MHAFVIGEHGDSELAVWSTANVFGIDLEEFFLLRGCSNYEKEREQIYQDVRDSAYAIIERKGATYYGIGIAVARIAECIVRDSHTVLPISVLLKGEYGLDGVCLSIPTVVGQNGAEQILDIALSQEEYNKLISSAAELKKILVQIE